jgi:hypothetical protein
VTGVFSVRGGQRFRVLRSGQGFTLEQWSHLTDEWLPLPGTFTSRSDARRYARQVVA